MFSSMHVSGQQLDLYTGIAAILRFPVYAEEPQEEPPASDGNPGSNLELGVVGAESSDEEDEFTRRCVDGGVDMNIFS